MKIIKYFLFSLICLFSCSVVFADNEVVIKSITPVYDEASTLKVTDEENNHSIVFNDKNQSVKYLITLQNTFNYDVLIKNITLTTPTEEFFKYSLEGLEEYDVLKSKDTKEVIVLLETIQMDGWGRNFNDDLIASVEFEKYVEPKIPFDSTKDLISSSNKIEIFDITSSTIAIEDKFQVEKEKIGAFIYPEKLFLGYFNVTEENEIKKIDGLVDVLKEEKIKNGEHHIALVSTFNEKLGYLNIRVNEKNEVLKGNYQEDINNPFTSANSSIVMLIITSGITIISIVLYRNKKVPKYGILVIMLGITIYASSLNFTKAKETFVLPIKINVSYESQNVMKPSNCVLNEDERGNKFISGCEDYWSYNYLIKNIYFEDSFRSMSNYLYRFDVSDKQNERVIAYLVKSEENNDQYDLFLQSDGVIYANENSSYYFANMYNLDNIINGFYFDTSDVVNMSHMFYNGGSKDLDYSSILNFFDTSKVTDMSGMFASLRGERSEYLLDLSNFDTSNVTNMNEMFLDAGYFIDNFMLDLSNFDTSKVTDMGSMFYRTGYSSKVFTLDVTNFDTSSVKNARAMFYQTGHSSKNFTLDVSNFDTSNVTDMGFMFFETGYSNPNFTLDVSNFNTSNVTDMGFMFCKTGYSNPNFTLNLTGFDTSRLRDTSFMFNKTGFNSIKLNIVITIRSPYITDYSAMFQDAATKSGSQIMVNYTKDTEALVDKMIASKSTNSNVVKGRQVD